jgi:hypothetical protein
MTDQPGRVCSRCQGAGCYECCDLCNYDRHVCPGCGEPLSHGVGVCSPCLAEIAPARGSS